MEIVGLWTTIVLGRLRAGLLGILSNRAKNLVIVDSYREPHM